MVGTAPHFNKKFTTCIEGGQSRKSKLYTSIWTPRPPENRTLHFNGEPIPSMHHRLTLWCLNVLALVLLKCIIIAILCQACEYKVGPNSSICVRGFRVFNRAVCVISRLHYYSVDEAANQFNYQPLS